eukprot:7002348-Heterocapsa_arctica.AAC.1
MPAPPPAVRTESAGGGRSRMPRNCPARRWPDPSGSMPPAGLPTVRPADGPHDPAAVPSPALASPTAAGPRPADISPTARGPGSCSIA